MRSRKKKEFANEVDKARSDALAKWWAGLSDEERERISEERSRKAYEVWSKKGWTERKMLARKVSEGMRKMYRRSEEERREAKNRAKKSWAIRKARREAAKNGG